MSRLQQPLSLSLSSSSPSSSSATDSSTELRHDDALEVAQRIEGVQAELSTLPPSQQVDFLLQQLHSSYTTQRRSQRETERWQASSLEQTKRATDAVSRCQKVQQRIDRVVHEAAALKEDMRGLQLTVAGMEEGEDASARLNGKEEKEPNGHGPHTAWHRPRPPASPDSLMTALGQPSSSAQSPLSDFSTLLATTEAQLEVERRERERQQPPSATSSSTQLFSSSSPSRPAAASSPYYHHDHALTAAGKGVVRSIFLLFASPASSSSSMSLQQLQALSERVGRGGAAAGAADGDDGGDVWWLWQSHASEDEGGGMGLTEEDLQAVYASEWDLDEDAKKLHIQ